MPPTIELFEISKLKPYENNARLISEDAIKQLMEAIKEFGFRDPIEILADGEILAGHRRMIAAQRLGLTRIPAIIYTDMTRDEAKAYRIASNKIAEGTSWELSALSDELTSLEGKFTGASMGFGDKELADIFQLNVEGPDLGEEEAPPTPADPLAPEAEKALGDPICRPGEIWDLGPHQLTVGSSHCDRADDMIHAWQKKTKHHASLEGKHFKDIKTERKMERKK